MHILIFKNQSKRQAQAFRQQGNVHIFNNLEEAVAQGQQQLQSPGNQFDAFHTMTLQHFINMMSDKFEVAV
jgi:hypothetical protein